MTASMFVVPSFATRLGWKFTVRAPSVLKNTGVAGVPVVVTSGAKINPPEARVIVLFVPEVAIVVEAVPPATFSARMVGLSARVRVVFAAAKDRKSVV